MENPVSYKSQAHKTPSFTNQMQQSSRNTFLQKEKSGKKEFCIDFPI